MSDLGVSPDPQQQSGTAIRAQQAAANQLMVGLTLALLGAAAWLIGDDLHHNGHSWAAIAILHLIGAGLGVVGLVLVALRIDRAFRG